MKTRYTLWCVVLFVLFTMHPLAAQDHLVLSRAEKLSGATTLAGERILKKAYAELGIDFEFRELPNVRAMVTANSGGTDGAFLRLAGLEQTYPNLVMISVPMGYVDIVVYTKETEFAVKGWQSLAPYSIGFVRGFKLAELRTKGMHVEEVNSVEQAFLKLDTGRNDVVVESRSAQCRLKNLDVSGVRILEPPIDQLVLYHYLHKRHRGLAAKLEVILTRMQQEGEFTRIQEQATKDYQEVCGQ
ncbi:substrate-binding periplasmic protein [Desulfogranum japonicum]|uniref:substrate-binding periplasmic protein n=1 Tax=Desulfogranum japonicum TaxID=231447 RepID=UPI0004247090|nr:transporter substrate-binding domain-containing protein [Desulfogranum japonicum]